MSALVAAIIQTIFPATSADPEEQNANLLYPFTIFFAVGIWLVFKRYEKLHTSAKDFDWPPPAAADPKYRSTPIPDANLESHESMPELQPPLSVPGRRYITSFDPATSLHIGTFVADNEEEIENKIRRALHAQKEWRHTTFTQRRRVMRSLLKWLVEHQDDCANVACRDTGKTRIDAALVELITTCSKLEWLMKHGEKALKPEKRHGNFAMFYKSSEVHYEPLGVVAAIVSWNYPLHNAWSPIIASIFSGNAIVLKCSESVIWSSTWFVGALTECLRVCGHDPELVQIICCFPETAKALTMSPMIKHITFIGSEEVGRKIAIDATRHLTPITLELGGKDPAIILPGTDLNKWISLWMRGVFQNAGQNCIGIERLIVHADQHDELFELFSERAQKLRLGSVLAPSQEGYINTVDCGAMINANRFRGLEKIVRDAGDAGAKVVGGTQWNHAYLENGYYFDTTVVGNVDDDMDIAKEEVFGPIATLMPYRTVEEAIDIANGTKYGLGASVFGPDQRLCVDVAKRLDCGMVSVNDFGVFYLNQDLPFGGTKLSGWGRFGGPEGLRALTNPKAIMVDRWPSVIQTTIPAVVDYPIKSLVHGWQFVSGLIGFLYADGWRARMRGLVEVIKAARS